jgi:hypothetical protein
MIGSAVLSGEVCTACECGYKSKTGQKTPTTIDSFSKSSITQIIPPVRRKDKPDVKIVSHPPALVIDGKITHERWLDVDVFMTWRPKYQSKKWNRKDSTRCWLDRWCKHNRVIEHPWDLWNSQALARGAVSMTRPPGLVPLLVPPIPTTIPSIVTECRKTGKPEWVYPYDIQPNVTAGVGLDDALNSWKTTTSLDQNYGDTEYTDDGDAIEIAEKPQTSVTLVPSVPSRYTVEELTEALIEYHMEHHGLTFDITQKEFEKGLVRWKVRQAIQEFDDQEPAGVGNRNARIAEFVRKKFRDDAVLSLLTEKKIRRIREEQRMLDESPFKF